MNILISIDIQTLFTAFALDIRINYFIRLMTICKYRKFFRALGDLILNLSGRKDNFSGTQVSLQSESEETVLSKEARDRDL